MAEVDVPRKIVHNKDEECKWSDTGARFAWIDLSEILHLEGYGFWFPAWKIHTELEYCTLYMDSSYRGSNGKEVVVRFQVEHKEKVEGKRFKRYTYSVEKMAELLKCYSDKVNKAKTAAQTLILAKVQESISATKSEWIYAVGYINGKMFYSQDIENFRRLLGKADRQGGKQVSAASFKLIAEGLTQEDVKRIEGLNISKGIALHELMTLDYSFNQHTQHYPFHQFKVYGCPTEQYLEDSYGRYTTVKGYPQKIQAITESIEQARSFLKDSIKQIEDDLDSFKVTRCDSIVCPENV